VERLRIPEAGLLFSSLSTIRAQGFSAKCGAWKPQLSRWFRVDFGLFDSDYYYYPYDILTLF
jgi:hypothetical protein